jgi:hypothetical protein
LCCFALWPPALYYLHMQDLPNALSEAQIAEAMGLHDIKTRPWAIFKTSAIKGDGLFEVSQVCQKKKLMLWKGLTEMQGRTIQRSLHTSLYAVN